MNLNIIEHNSLAAYRDANYEAYHKEMFDVYGRFYYFWIHIRSWILFRFSFHL